MVGGADATGVRPNGGEGKRPDVEPLQTGDAAKKKALLLWSLYSPSPRARHAADQTCRWRNAFDRLSIRILDVETECEPVEIQSLASHCELLLRIEGWQ
jgi:hypothetical protein